MTVECQKVTRTFLHGSDANYFFGLPSSFIHKDACRAKKRCDIQHQCHEAKVSQPTKRWIKNCIKFSVQHHNVCTISRCWGGGGTDRQREREKKNDLHEHFMLGHDKIFPNVFFFSLKLQKTIRHSICGPIRKIFHI